MKELPVLNSRVALRGKKVLLRLDWNIPIKGTPKEEDLAKIENSVKTVHDLQKKGAVVVILTHLGRPVKREKELSTVRLLPLAEAYLDCPVMFCGEDIFTEEGRSMVKDSLQASRPGDVLLLENVRFYAGEEKNDKKLSQAYADLADYYVNDAFAACHRAHSSVAGIPAYLPHFAGSQLTAEVAAAGYLLRRPKKPLVAIIGGAKLSTKIPVVKSLLKVADHVLIGGAMAHPFLVAQNFKIGKSLMEKQSLSQAKLLLKNKKIMLPVDFLVADKINDQVKPKCVPVNQIKAKDMIGDIGTQTMRQWSALINKAQTILWNGPLGVAEYEPFAFGSLLIGRAVAARSKGKAYGLVGGGDTVPVALQTGMSQWFDHISMGGGALLEFIANNGKLPGIEALYRPASSFLRPAGDRAIKPGRSKTKKMARGLVKFKKQAVKKLKAVKKLSIKSKSKIKTVKSKKK